MSPDVPPEAEVIRLAREAMDMTAQRAAEASRAHDGKGVSAAYWRDVERGYGGRRGQRVPTRASARALAAMARVVGVVPPQLASAGREDAARVLEEVLRREQPAPVTSTGSIALPPLATTGVVADDAAAVMENAVVTAALPRREREIWAEMRESLQRTPAGRELFSDPSQVALWPEGGAPLKVTPEAKDLLDSTPPDVLFDARVDILVASLVEYSWHERVQLAAAGRALFNSPTKAVRRAG